MLILSILAFRFLVVNSLPPSGGNQGGPRQLWQNNPTSSNVRYSAPVPTLNNNYAKPYQHKPYRPSFEMNDDEYFGLNKHHKQQEPVNKYEQNNQYQTNHLRKNDYHNNQYGQNNNYRSNHRNTQQNTNDFRFTRPSFEKKDYANVHKPGIDYNSNMLNSYDSLRSQTHNPGFEGKPLVDIRSNLLNTYNDLGKTNYQDNTVQNVPSFEKEHKYDPYNYFGTKDYSKTVIYNKDDTKNEVHKILYPVNNNVPQFEKMHEYPTFNKYNHNQDQGKYYKEETNYVLNPSSYVQSFEKEDSLYLKNENTVPYIMRHIKNKDEDNNESYTEKPEIKYEHMPLTNNPYRENTGDDNYNLYKENTGDDTYNPYKENTGDDYNPYKENTGDERYNPYKENTGDDYDPYKENTGDANYNPYKENNGDANYNSYKENTGDDRYNPYKENTGDDRYNPYKENTGNDDYNPYKENTGDDKYNPYKENTGNDKYNPYKENTGGHAHSTEVVDGYKYDPATDPYAEPLLYNPDKRQGHLINLPNPAYLSPFEPYDPSLVGQYTPKLTVVATEPRTIGHLYTEDLTDYQSFVAKCYEKKFGTIKVSSLKDPNARSMRMYSKEDSVESPEYPLTQDLTDFSYENLRLTPHGRHLLLVTLLENFENSYWEHRCEGLVQIYLPDTLKSSEQPPTPETACNLREIRVNATYWTREDCLNVFNGIFASKIGKDDHFSRYDEEHTEAVKSLVKLALSMPDFDAMVSLLTVIRGPCNKRLYIEAMVTLIQARDDVGFIIPSIVSLAPELFVPKIEETRRARQFRGNRNEVIRFRSTHRTYPANEPEGRMWHIREDPIYSTMHWTWHSILNGANIGRLMQRRGELFFYMHRQMLNRYNCDRLAVNLSPVDAYGPADWQRRGALIGYSPNLSQYSSRSNGMAMANNDADNLNRVRRRLFEAVDSGQINGQRLGYVQGQDVGISALGDAIEPFGNTNTGNYHNRGHVVTSGMSNPGAGVMGGTENAIKDPAFFRWHQNIDLVFARYKQSLGPYPDSDLSFPGVTVTGINTVSQGRQNRLRTFLQVDTIQISTDFLVSNGGGSQIRIERVAHDPFVYNFQLEVTTNEQFGIGRVFLVPTQVANGNVYDYAIEMDKFLIRLNPGTMNIQRTTAQSPLFSRGPPSLNNLQNRLLRGMSERDFNWANCGYPLDMAVPRGSNTNMEFQLFFMVTQLLPQDRQRVNEWSGTETAWGWCGFRDGQRGLPDGRPMAFPFDRRMSVTDVTNGRSNAASESIIIRHDGAE